MEKESKNNQSRYAPLTPPLGDFVNEGPNMKNDMAIKPAIATTESTISSQPYLACARRVSPLSSTFQLQDSRYLLTFASESTLQEWWVLMQSEYSGVVRESPQLFSFRGDRVPSRAWDNPKFAHLQEKWTCQKLAKTKHAGHGNSPEKQGLLAKRASSTTALTKADSRDPSSSPELVRDADILDDPFTPIKCAAQQKTDIAQFSITSERIHKTVSQSKADINTLIEGQQSNSRVFRRMQTGIEQLTAQVTEVSQRHAAGEKAMHQIQASHDRSAAEIKSLVQRPQADLSSTPTLQTLQAEVSQNSVDVKTLLDGQKAVKKSVARMHTTLEQQAARQESLAEQLRELRAANMQNQTLIKTLVYDETARFELLLSAFEQHTLQTRKIAETQQDSIESSREDVLAAIKDGISSCDHDIVPPPRKVNRKLVGYVYSRNGN